MQWLLNRPTSKVRDRPPGGNSGVESTSTKFQLTSKAFKKNSVAALNPDLSSLLSPIHSSSSEFIFFLHTSIPKIQH